MRDHSGGPWQAVGAAHPVKVCVLAVQDKTGFVAQIDEKDREFYYR